MKLRTFEPYSRTRVVGVRPSVCKRVSCQEFCFWFAELQNKGPEACLPQNSGVYFCRKVELNRSTTPPDFLAFYTTKKLRRSLNIMNAALHFLIRRAFLTAAAGSLRL